MRERWAAYKAAHSAAEEVCLAESLGTNDFPLNTNGERFPLTIENEIVSHHNSISNSRYWATVDEAYYLYNVAFHPSYLTPEHRVRVDSNTSKLVYYNVCGTADPSVFNPSTCVRYDPFNYRGKYYHPVTALMMKRFAIANNVLDQKQWASLQLISTMGFTTSKPPLLLVLGDFDVALQNINLTNSPELLASKLGSSPDAEESFEDDILVNGMNPHSDSPDI
ncbi:hypothetical protein AGDE_09382 [Angomonas deanei]|nr:hypothetical protein AGDE_09382 [Angomonas deanei]|eukprot:EPY30560.1 hypothetical protein AGDE_09382 [Angomonas deanei]